MRLAGSEKLVFTAFAGAMMFGLAGCENLPAAITGDASANNARMSLMATQGGKTTKTVLYENSKANFTSADGKADLVIASSSYHDLKGLTQSNATPGLFFNADATAVVKAQPDADGNGVADTFFIMTEQNLPGQRFERGIAYVGPYTDHDVIDGHRTNQVTATYTGLAGVSGTVGESTVNANGTLELQASFSLYETTFNGKMALAGASQFDGATFRGKLTDEYSDYLIDRAVLTKDGTAITDGTQGTGVGSFIGRNGQGTMGAFSISSPVTGSADIANMQGWFIGSADILK